MHLYAVSVEEIEEVTKSTHRTYINKDAERAAYNQKLDNQESFLNAATYGHFVDNTTAHAMGVLSRDNYIQEEMVRGMMEADFESKLSQRPDYEDYDTYRRAFLGLYRIVLYNCADVLISTEEKTPGHCAVVLLPRQDQKYTQLFVRATDKNNPFSGRIEPYDGIPGYYEIDSGGGPTIEVVADKLMSGETAEVLHIQDCDVLQGCPDDMLDVEYAYLLWRDNPMKRRKNKD